MEISTSTLQLPGNGRIADLRILRQQKGFAQDNGQGLVALEGQEDAIFHHATRPSRRDDAQVLVIRFHQDIPRAQMDFICADVAAHF